MIALRPARPSDTAQIAQLWYDAWRDAHLAHLPAELVRLRTPANFLERTPALINETTVATDETGIVGFCTVREDELDSLFVSADARGSGCAAQLLTKAELTLVQRGVRRAWLACVLGNERAARFYTRHGWERTGTAIHETAAGGATFQLEVWRYEKTLDVER